MEPLHTTLQKFATFEALRASGSPHFDSVRGEVFRMVTNLGITYDAAYAQFRKAHTQPPEPLPRLFPQYTPLPEPKPTATLSDVIKALTPVKNELLLEIGKVKTASACATESVLTEMGNAKAATESKLDNIVDRLKSLEASAEKILTKLEAIDFAMKQPRPKRKTEVEKLLETQAITKRSK